MRTYTCSELKVLDLVPFGQTGNDFGCYALRLERPEWTDWRPGQFVMLRTKKVSGDVLWGRPFSICRVSGYDLVVFFQVVGRATEQIAEVVIGDTVTVWGPLGNGFAVEPDSPTLMLAGGVGIAPFVGYAYEHPKPWNLWMDFGHRLPLGCYPFESLNEKIEADSHLETSVADRDKFLANIRKRMEEIGKEKGLVLACGPIPFLRVIQQNAKEIGVRTQISLENRMACGIGACLGCVCKTSEKWPDKKNTDGYVQSCTHGPVFWSENIVL